jgi:serine/threonine protein kinase
VKRIKQDGRTQYEIVVGDKTYRTVSVLSDFGADPLLGRGTRVFKVYDIKDLSRTPRALKDVWVETDCRREGDILAELLEKISSTCQGADLDAARRHFLTVLCHEDVMIDGIKDHTKHFLGGENLPAECDDMQLLETLFHQMHALEGSYTTGIGGVPLIPCMRVPTRRKARVPSRTHYRIVFEEVGLVAHHLSSLPDAYQALHDAVEGSFLTLLHHSSLLTFFIGQGLRIMHAHGYVHRDISTGNIIFNEGHGKIADSSMRKKLRRERHLKSGWYVLVPIVQPPALLISLHRELPYSPP